MLVQSEQLQSGQKARNLVVHNNKINTLVLVTYQHETYLRYKTEWSLETCLSFLPRLLWSEQSMELFNKISPIHSKNYNKWLISEFVHIQASNYSTNVAGQFRRYQRQGFYQ